MPPSAVLMTSKTSSDSSKDGQQSLVASHPFDPTEILISPSFPKVTQQDPYLENFRHAIRRRFEKFKVWMDVFEKSEGGIFNVASSYQKMGFSVDQDNTITYREYARSAREAYLIGDFNNWNRNSHPMKKDEFGFWKISLPPVIPTSSSSSSSSSRQQTLENQKPQLAIPHNTKVKISMVAPDGERIERVPAYARRVEQDLSKSVTYDAVFWHPPMQQRYQFKNASPPKPNTLRIYEAHVGIASPEGKIATYNEFTTNVLPRIQKLGYNAIQLMAIMEHAYYASFGYQVTSFFAASSRYGSPEDLKELIDTAHGMGIVVLLDVVHSHASKNVLDGLNMFDGTDHCYFHGGPMGWHSLWDSRLFNYGSYETLRFLLSNCLFWLDEYHFDGFRFDGVTSMLYKHHGIGYGFSGNYEEYFNDNVDEDAVVYLMLANTLIHSYYPQAITVAEDVSGMPTLCRPVEEGGVGFDYRLGMAIPDMWIKLLKEKSDEEWDMGNIVHTLTNRRWQEKTIGYAESHDQALVGDKTIAFWLMDKEMYDFMSDVMPLTPIIERGLALHKLIRLLTFGLGGEGYLNFIGNEFGHPEWLDFPRQGNNDSYHYCRRQYNLVDDSLLRFKYLYNFDIGMMSLDKKHECLVSNGQEYVSLKHESDKVIAFEKKGLVWIFNFHVHQSYSDYRIGVEVPGVYKITLTSDAKEFGGFDRIDKNGEYHTTPEPWCHRKNFIQVYIPSRTALVLEKEK